MATSTTSHLGLRIPKTEHENPDPAKQCIKQCTKEQHENPEPPKHSKCTKTQNNEINPILHVLLQGLYDNESTISVLRGSPHIVQIIWRHVIDFWRSLINIGCRETTPPNLLPYSRILKPQNRFVLPVVPVMFPKPQNLSISMMPFVMNPQFDDCYLPQIIRSYWEHLIRPLFRTHCAEECHLEQEVGKICYLTIHESYIDPGKSQRRLGLHTSHPGRVVLEETEETEKIHNETIVRGKGTSNVCFTHVSSRAVVHPRKWRIVRSNQLNGGIYIATNAENSYRVWDCQIKKGVENEIIGKFGDVEHLRQYLDNGETIKSNTIYWITDRTPHESLPILEGTYRQYFSLVTHEVSLWFEDYYTQNPFGIEPDPSITKVVKRLETKASVAFNAVL